MIGAVLASIVLTAVPFEPSVDCLAARKAPTYVYIEVTEGSRITWNMQQISRAEFDAYVSQEHQRRPIDRDGFKVVRDAKSEAAAMDIVQELKRNGIPFAKNCSGIP